MDKIKKAVNFLSTISAPPSVGIILGSGLGEMVKHMEDIIVVPYYKIPFFQVTTAHSHDGELLIGELF